MGFLLLLPDSQFLCGGSVCWNGEQVTVLYRCFVPRGAEGTGSGLLHPEVCCGARGFASPGEAGGFQKAERAHPGCGREIQRVSGGCPGGEMPGEDPEFLQGSLLLCARCGCTMGETWGNGLGPCPGGTVLL